MNKIPFDIKYRPEIEAGEYRVETREGEPVEIVLWDWCGGSPYPILGRVGNNGDPFIWTSFGRFDLEDSPKDEKYDLFLVPTASELSEFENRLCEILEFAWKRKDITKTNGEIIEDAKRLGPELLALARKENEKDLPRWKKANGKERFDENVVILTTDNCLLCDDITNEGEYYIEFSALEKLPKEE